MKKYNALFIECRNAVEAMVEMRESYPLITQLITNEKYDSFSKAQVDELLKLARGTNRLFCKELKEKVMRCNTKLFRGDTTSITDDQRIWALFNSLHKNMMTDDEILNYLNAKKG